MSECHHILHEKVKFFFIYLVFNIVLLCFVQMDFYEPAAVQFYADSLAHDFTWEDQVFKNGIVHCSKRTAEMPYLYR